MFLTSVWIRKTMEARLVTAIEWSQRNNKKVQSLTQADFDEIFKNEEALDFDS